MDHEKLRMSIKLSTKTFDSEKKKWNEIMCSGKKKALKEVWGYDDIVWK